MHATLSYSELQRVGHAEMCMNYFEVELITLLITC